MKTVLPKKKRRGWLVLLLLLLWIPPYPTPPLPLGMDREGPPHRLEEARTRVLFDLTGLDSQTRERVIRQQILDDLLEGISRAERFIVLDFFLWNDWKGASTELHRPMAREWAKALISRKRARPDLHILAVTD
ncbi:MAG: hypothetical protein U1E27_03255, partial [Kiritimatiellia bacterium]|nr:hypothetical protein [Kiritimatiellia bacterium]